MKVLPLTFGILTACGFWLPENLDRPLKKFSYNIFSFFMFFLISSFTLSHFIDIIISAKSFEDLTGSCFMLLSMLNVCCKMTNILYFRRNIIRLLKILENDPCKARNTDEQNLVQKFHNKARLTYNLHFLQKVWKESVRDSSYRFVCLVLDLLRYATHL